MARTKNFNTDAVLDKAIELFRMHGYQATTPAQLVDHMGISRSSLYDTFGDKRGLYIKALHRYSSRVDEQFSGLVAQAQDARQAIRNCLQLSLEGCFGKDMPAGCLLTNSIAELPADGSEVMSIITDSKERNKKALLRLLKKAQTDGQLSADANINRLADYFMNAIIGLTISAKAGVSKKVCQQVVDTTLSILA